MVEVRGFDPRSLGPKPNVLPLDDTSAERAGVDPARPLARFVRFRNGCRLHIGLPFQDGRYRPAPSRGFEPRSLPIRSRAFYPLNYKGMIAALVRLVVRRSDRSVTACSFGAAMAPAAPFGAVDSGRFERPAFALSERCSDQIELRAGGTPCRVRTGRLHLERVASSPTRPTGHACVPPEGGGGLYGFRSRCLRLDRAALSRVS